MKQLGDVRKINGAEIEPVWCITGGSPCQDLSVAGKRKGLKHSELGDEENTRSGLFMEQIRIVKEMRENDKRNGRPDELIRPKYMCWENVPGAYSVSGGADFAALIEEIIGVVCETKPILEVPVGGWPKWGASVTLMEDGVLLGALSTLSISECPSQTEKQEILYSLVHRNAGGVFVSSLTSTETQLTKYCLVAPKLSQMLEADPHPRHYLTPRACNGILRRAERRGKELPETLKKALEWQCHTENYIKLVHDWYYRHPEVNDGLEHKLINTAIKAFNNEISEDTDL